MGVENRVYKLMKLITSVLCVQQSLCFPKTDDVLNELFQVSKDHSGNEDAMCLGTGPTINNCTTRIISEQQQGETGLNSTCIYFTWIYGKDCYTTPITGVKNVTYVGELVVWDKNETTKMIKVSNYAPIGENYTVVESYPSLAVSKANKTDLPLVQEDLTFALATVMAKPWAAAIGIVGVVIGVIGIGASTAIAYSAVTTAEMVSWDVAELALDLDAYIIATDLRLRKIESQIALLTMVNTGRCPRYPCCVLIEDARKYKNHTEYYRAKAENITKVANRIKRINDGLQTVQDQLRDWWDSIWGWGWKAILTAVGITIGIVFILKIVLKTLSVDNYERLRE